MFQKIYGLGKVKLKIKQPGRLEKTQIQQKTLKRLISGFTPREHNNPNRHVDFTNDNKITYNVEDQGLP